MGPRARRGPRCRSRLPPRRATQSKPRPASATPSNTTAKKSSPSHVIATQASGDATVRDATRIESIPTTGISPRTTVATVSPRVQATENAGSRTRRTQR